MLLVSRVDEAFASAQALASAQGQEEEPEEEVDDDTGMTSRPCKVQKLGDDSASADLGMTPRGCKVPKLDDVWIVSDRDTYHKLRAVLEVRDRLLARAGLEPSAMLPFAFQKEGQASLRSAWMETDDGREWVASQVKFAAHMSALNSADWKNTDPQLEIRLTNSIWRKQQYLDFGGSIWAHLLLALGDIPDDLVEMVNQENQSRRLKNREAAQTGVDLSSQGQAESAGKRKRRVERGEPEVGINHEPSEGRKARQWAQWFDKEIHNQNMLWKGSRLDHSLASAQSQKTNILASRMTNAQWFRLLADREKAWDEAEDISMRAGFPFLDRDRVMKCAEYPQDIVGIVLRRYCLQHNLLYS